MVKLILFPFCYKIALCAAQTVPLNLKDIFITADDELILYPKEGKEHRTAYGGRKKPGMHRPETTPQSVLNRSRNRYMAVQ